MEHCSKISALLPFLVVFLLLSMIYLWISYENLFTAERRHFLNYWNRCGIDVEYVNTFFQSLLQCFCFCVSIMWKIYIFSQTTNSFSINVMFLFEFLLNKNLQQRRYFVLILWGCHNLLAIEIETFTLNVRSLTSFVFAFFPCAELYYELRTVRSRASL